MADTTARAARCRRASSRSAARATARRPSSGGSRRRRGRTSRRAPSRRASAGTARPSRATPRAGTRAPARAGTSARARSRPSARSSWREQAALGLGEQSFGERLAATARPRPSCAERTDDRLGLRCDVLRPLAVRVGDSAEHLPERRAARAAARAGSTCRRRRARPSGVRKTVSGQPPWPVERDDGVHVDRVDVGPLLAVDLDVDEELVHERARSRRPRTTRAPSRGTSGRRE